MSYTFPWGKKSNLEEIKIAGPQTYVKQVATDIFRVIFSLRVELQRN